MPRLGLSKRLLPTKKAWRILTSKLGTKLSKIKRSKSLKRAAARLNAIRQRSRRRSTYHVSLDRMPARTLQNHQCFAPVYVEELYSRPMQVHVADNLELAAAEAKTTLHKKHEAANDRFDVFVGPSSSSSSSSSSGSSSSCVVAEISEVDLRADMFIRKFKEEKKLERQRSFEEYQEMLARGV